MELNSDYTGNFVKFNYVFIKGLFSIKVSKKKKKKCQNPELKRFRNKSKQSKGCSRMIFEVV